MAPHPIVPNVVDERLAKGSIKPWMGGAGF